MTNPKKSMAIGNRINSAAFDFSAGRQRFTVDISRLSGEALDPFAQLWHDEGAEGFVMVSQRTRDEVAFVKDHTEREADGEIRFWIFRPHRVARTANPRLERVMAVVYNT